MHCPSCGHPNPDDASFCGECGAAAVAASSCPACGRTSEPGQRFCHGCGEALGGAAPSERAPRDYTPKHLADKILQSRSALEGERKRVTVLFADVKDSMGLAQELDPEEWHTILNRFFEILAEGVHRFEGTINQYTGDGIMALFGAPIAHEDHAQRACFAALHLRETLRSYADELRRTRSLNLSVRIGINSGEVVVGKIGSDLRMDYTAQGQVVGLAQRMEVLAEPGNAYLTENTARLVSGYFELRELGEFEIAGVAEPVAAYALEGVGALRTRLDLSRARGFSKFVGRAREMERLEAAFARASEGDGQVVCVVGEAGVGKSRLCSEFVESCQARGIATNETHCPAHGKTIPLLPILELMRSFFRIADRDPDAEARRKVAGTLVLLDESFRDSLPLVFDFLGVPDPARPPPDLEPEARQSQLLEFVRRFAEARSAEEPAVILVDDLHWVDPGSDAFVAQLVDAVEGTRTLLLLNYRPEYDADWTRRAHVDERALVPLDAEAIAELVRDLLGTDASVAALPERIRERTGGNPFFSEEVVQSLIESGHLQGSRGDYRLVTPVDRIEVPDRVQVVLAARIDRLAEREKQTLQAAAVIGRMFDTPLLEVVTELPAEELAAALQALDAAEMARQTALYPVAEYMFKHPLTHEVALDSQLREARSRRHLAVARALEERHADKLDENAALLAYHFDEAGEVLDAARWHVRAAQWISYNDVVEALRHWTRVPELAGELPGADAADLCVFASQRILLLQGNLGIERAQADALLERGRRLAGRSRDTEATAKLLTSYGLAIGLTGAMPDAHAAMEESLVLTRDDPGSDQHLDTGQMACWVLHSLGRLHEADARFRVILAANSEGTSALFDTPIHSSASLLGGWLLLERGRLDEAGSLFTRLWSEGMGRLNALLIACIHGFDARRLAHQGDLDRALRMASDGIELAEKSRNPNALSVVYQVLGEVQNLRGDFSGGRESLQEGLRVARESGTMLNLEARTVLELARSHLGLGEHERALEVADEAISVAQLRSARHHEGLANVVRAEVLLGAYSPDRADEIEALLKRAADLIEESGYGLAERDLERARAALSRARGTGQAAPGR